MNSPTPTLADAIKHAEQAIRRAEIIAQSEAQRWPRRYGAIAGNLAGAADLVRFTGRRLVTGSAN